MMNSNRAAAVDDIDAPSGLLRRRRSSRLALSSSASNSRQENAAGSSRRNSTTSLQQQLESDEAIARRLQVQFDRQYRAEQNRRRQCEGTAVRRQTRAQTANTRPGTPDPVDDDAALAAAIHGGTYRVRATSRRPPTPPPDLYWESCYNDYEDEDADDEEGEDRVMPLAIASVLMEQDASADRSSRGRRAQQGGSSSNGPTTLAVVRRYFQEAHLDANLFPDGTILDYEALLELADELVDGAPSMSTAEINRLPTSVYRNHMLDAETSSSTSGSSNSMATISSDDSAPMCSICMETFCDGDVQRHLPCLHSYHKGCVDVWLKQRSSCPVCRVDARSLDSP